MRIGTTMQGAGATLDDLVGQARAAESAGFDSLYVSQMTDWDALGLVALLGREVPRITLGTSAPRRESRASPTPA